MVRLIILLAYAFVGVMGAPPLCKFADKVCTKNLMNDLFKTIITTDKLDPLYIELIVGDLPGLKFKLKETTVKGYSDCHIEKANLNLEKPELDTEIFCPALNLKGNYEADGRLLTIPVNGSGTYDITTKSYLFKFHGDLALEKKDGNLFIQFNGFNVTPEPLENIVFEFKNLFNGQKDLSDAIHKFANENWKEVAKEIQGPGFDATFRIFVQSGNKMFKNEPLTKYIEF